MTNNNDTDKDYSLDASMDYSSNKGETMSRVSDLDLAIEQGLSDRKDFSNVLKFPANKAKESIKEQVNRNDKEIHDGTATEGDDRDQPLIKTLGITDLDGNLRKKYAGKTTEAYISEGGETRETVATSTESGFVETEPPYYKVYVDTIGRIQGIPYAVRAFVGALGKFMTYEGTIQLTKKAKGKIAEELKVTEGTIANYLTKATKTGLLINNGGGEYCFHPSVMGRGTWKDVKKHRTDLYNHAVGIVRLDHTPDNGTVQRFEFLDIETAEAVLKVMGADEEALKRQIKIFRDK
jgi:hypothetical protein